MDEDLQCLECNWADNCDGDIDHCPLRLNWSAEEWQELYTLKEN